MVVVRKGRDEILKIGLPRAYQGTKELPVRFVRKDKSSFGFVVEGYDPVHPLLIDPTAIISSPLEDKISHIYIDRTGNVLVTGWTLDYYNFVGGSSFGNPDIGVRSAFVVKLTPDLSTVLASAIIAGSSQDYGWAVGVDDNGYVYVGGSTKSSDFAPSRVIYGTTVTDKYQWFVTKISPDLSTHVRTVIISGANHDLFRDLEISDNGDIYVAGYTYDYSSFAPTRNTMGSCSPPDAAVVRLDTSLSSFGDATVVCGDVSDGALGLTVTRDAVLLSGTTNSSYYAPSRVVFGPLGNWNAFVTKLSRDIRTHIASVIISSFQYDVAYETIVDTSGYVNVVGFTYDGTSFSTSRDILGTAGTYDVFITRLSPDLNTHVRTLIVASPDTDLVYVKTSAHQGDTMFVLINTQDPSGLASSCSSCNLVGGGGPWDAVVVGVTMDLSTCVGRSIFTASGDEGAYALAVRDANVYAAGPMTNYNLSEYPDPQYEFGYSGDVDGYVILGRPQCLVGVSEAPANDDAQEVVITAEGIKFTIRHPAYVGYDVVAVDGRILQRRALGYLLPGRYAYRLNLRAPGGYVIKLRIGNRTEMRKVIVPAR